MNGHCSTCDIEDQCGYKYKPCDCCNYRKFVQKDPDPTNLVQKVVGAKVEVANFPVMLNQSANAPTWMQ